MHFPPELENYPVNMYTLARHNVSKCRPLCVHPPKHRLASYIFAQAAVFGVVFEPSFFIQCWVGQEYDATELMRRNGPFPSLGKILMDQGSADGFFTGTYFLISHTRTRSQKFSIDLAFSFDCVRILLVGVCLFTYLPCSFLAGFYIVIRQTAEARSPGESLRGKGPTHRDADAGTSTS